MPCFSNEGCASSSLQECIALLNHTRGNSPATLHSGVKTEKLSDPLQVMSPSVKEEQTTANGLASGSMSEGLPLPKDEPQSRADRTKVEVETPKPESTTFDVKEELSEQEADDQTSEVLREELQRSREEIPPHDSEDSLGPEHVADELRRLTEAQAQMTGSIPPRKSGGGATASYSTWENHDPSAPQRLRSNRGGSQTPDPHMFHSTIWLRHDQEASARTHKNP